MPSHKLFLGFGVKMFWRVGSHRDKTLLASMYRGGSLAIGSDIWDRGVRVDIEWRQEARPGVGNVIKKKSPRSSSFQKARCPTAYCYW